MQLVHRPRNVTEKKLFIAIDNQTVKDDERVFYNHNDKLYSDIFMFKHYNDYKERLLSTNYTKIFNNMCETSGYTVVPELTQQEPVIVPKRRPKMQPIAVDVAKMKADKVVELYNQYNNTDYGDDTDITKVLDLYKHAESMLTLGETVHQRLTKILEYRGSYMLLRLM